MIENLLTSQKPEDQPKDSFKEILRWREYQVKPQCEVELDFSKFIVKTANQLGEFEELLRLRHEVFYRELAGKTLPSGLDIDRFDSDCDYLVIIEKKSNQLIGSYRLRSSAKVEEFYSEQEFVLKPLLNRLKGVTIEIGRACIHKNFRKGMVLHLIWRGLVEYITKVDANYIMGCSSVLTEDAKEVSTLYHELVRNGDLVETSSIRPKCPFPILKPSELEGLESSRPDIPPLLEFYLRSGAKLYGTPAWDKDLKCVDFFTLLDMTSIQERYKRKYQV